MQENDMRENLQNGVQEKIIKGCARKIYKKVCKTNL